LGELSDLEIGQIVGARLAGVPVTITANLLVVHNAAVPKVVTTFANQWEDVISSEAQQPKPKTM
jgi:glucose-6-phosphate dehydrogenase assembly protein OpcA